jgi:hypothetical protein
MITRFCRAVGVLALVLFSGASKAGTVSGHYLVIEIDDAGQARPMFYRPVDFHERAIPNATDFKAAAHNPDQIAISSGNWRQVADVPQFVRGEFSINGGRGEIEQFKVRQPRRSFALRIPARAGTRLLIEFLGRTSELRIDQIAKQAHRLPLPARVEPVLLSATSGNRVDVLVLGDGYTAAEQATFNTDADSLRGFMFGMAPYKQYASFVNWTTHFSASMQSGVDHPPFQNACTTKSCCADTAAQTDPRAGIFVDTKFDGAFCTSQIHRLATVNSTKVLAEASAVPDWDEILVLLNDPVYGGSGGQFSVTSTHANAQLIVVHEYGHSFSRLADEYESPYPGYPACSDVSGTTVCQPNVTDQTTPSLIKWNDWIAPSTPIPTPAGASGVGLFQGARYQSVGMYRPQNVCTMRSLGSAFCAVCAQEYVLRLYRGGFGNPALGIDLIEPGSEMPSAAATVDYMAGQSKTFSATVLRPSPDTVSLQWYLDGVAIAGATSPSYVFHQAAATPSTRKLELLAFDASPLVHPDVATAPANIDMFSHWRTWNIQVQSPGTQLSIADVSISEGNSGTKVATFTVSLSAASTSAVTYNIATANGTAISGSDYVLKSLSGQSIPAGTISKTFNVGIKGDTVVEPNESFLVNVTNVAGATIADGQAVGTITNDDSGSTTPSLSIGDVTITEGNSGTKTATFTVSLSGTSTSAVTYNIATANGTATAGSDYVAASLTGQSIAAGSTSKAFAVTINGDTTVEANETFTVSVSSVVGATVADGAATGMITDDDGSGIDTTPPTAPTNLTATLGTLANVRLSWGPSSDTGSGVANYRVFRNGAQIATPAGTSYTDKPGAGQWSYVVKATDMAGNFSAASNTATITK